MGVSPKPQKKGSGKSTSPSPSDGSHVCSFYLKGKCTKGETCSLKHPRPCKFYAKGNCLKGNQCTFAHTKPTSPVGKSRDESPEGPREIAGSSRLNVPHQKNG